MSEEEQPNLLPIANIGRIMKRILPPQAKISKEAKERMQECASEFISFVTGEASDKCHRENRKTVNGDDICWALSSLGFDNYWEATSRYLLRYSEYDSQRANRGEKQEAGLGHFYEDDEATILRISVRDNAAAVLFKEGTTTSSSPANKRLREEER